MQVVLLNYCHQPNSCEIPVYVNSPLIHMFSLNTQDLYKKLLVVAAAQNCVVPSRCVRSYVQIFESRWPEIFKSKTIHHE